MTGLNLIEKLSKAFQAELPGLDAQAAMSPVGRMIALNQERIAAARKSAVLIPIYLLNDEAQIILIQRAEYPGVHSGQYAFPGGRVEAEDRDTEHTALRETEEEIGLGSDAIEVLGRMSQLFIPPSNSLVDPYVGFVEALPELILQESEVQRTIHFPVSTLLDDSIIKHSNDIKVRGLDLKRVPYFDIEGNVVWGATASMLNELKVLLTNCP